VDSLPWDSNAARRYAGVRAAPEIAGTPMGNLDMMIAAHALAEEAVLVTNDRSFRQIEGVKNRGFDTVEAFSAVMQACFSAQKSHSRRDQRQPTPSAWRRFRDSLKGDD